jgi:hypothetical protein
LDFGGGVKISKAQETKANRQMGLHQNKSFYMAKQSE